MDPAKAFGVDHTRDIDTRIGNVIPWRAYTSTRYPGNPTFLHKGGMIKMKILAPKDTPVPPIQEINYFGEAEVLVASGQNVRVLESHYDAGANNAWATVEIVRWGLESDNAQEPWLPEHEHCGSDRP